MSTKRRNVVSRLPAPPPRHVGARTLRQPPGRSGGTASSAVPSRVAAGGLKDQAPERCPTRHQVRPRRMNPITLTSHSPGIDLEYECMLALPDGRWFSRPRGGVLSRNRRRHRSRQRLHSHVLPPRSEPELQIVSSSGQHESRTARWDTGRRRRRRRRSERSLSGWYNTWGAGQKDDKILLTESHLPENKPCIWLS